MAFCGGNMSSPHFSLALAGPFEAGFFADASSICASLYERCWAHVEAEIEKAGSLELGGVRHAAAASAALDCWRPELGLVYRAVHEGRRGQASTRWLGFQAIVAGFLCRRIESFDVVCELESPFTVAGLTFDMQRVHGSGDGTMLCFEDMISGARHHFRISDDGTGGAGAWHSGEGSTNTIVSVNGTPLCQIVNGRWLKQWRFAEVAKDDSSQAGFVDQIGRALTVLSHGTEQYFLWVIAVVRHVIEMRRVSPSHSTSRSFLFHFGGVEIGAPASTIESIELLVHEASHQYFHMASLLGRTTTPQAGNHHSPLKGRVRPLERILLGYHAVGNIVLSLAAVGKHDPGTLDEVKSRLAVALPLLNELAAPLEGELETGLTSLGRGFFLPLHRQLHESGFYRGEIPC